MCCQPKCQLLLPSHALPPLLCCLPPAHTNSALLTGPAGCCSAHELSAALGRIGRCPSQQRDAQDNQQQLTNSTQSSSQSSTRVHQEVAGQQRTAGQQRVGRRRNGPASGYCSRWARPQLPARVPELLVRYRQLLWPLYEVLHWLLPATCCAETIASTVNNRLLTISHLLADTLHPLLPATVYSPSSIHTHRHTIRAAW